MPYKLLWLPTILRAAGLQVIETPGWATRGHGDVGETKGVILHHTAGSKTGNYPSLEIVTHGRPDLAGPLCNLGLGRDGVWYAVAAGKASHAGAGLWQGVHNGNSEMIGVEAENTGLANDNPWPNAQFESYAKGAAAILTHIRAKPIMACGHLEYALPVGRKSDPSFSVGTRDQRIAAMNTFRLKVAGYMGLRSPSMANAAIALPPTGTENTEWLQRSLNALGANPQLRPDGKIGPLTVKAIAAFQRANSAPVTGIADSATIAELHKLLDHHDGCACAGSPTP